MVLGLVAAQIAGVVQAVETTALFALKAAAHTAAVSDSVHILIV